jgi:hypothetical protein
MAVNFVGDNDHGGTVPPTDVLLQMIKTLREDVVHLAYELNEIKEGFEGCCNACEPVGLMNKKLQEERETYFTAHDELLAQTIELRSERDEARREVCDLKTFNFDNTISAYRYADLRKWDCYKDRADD